MITVIKAVDSVCTENLHSEVNEIKRLLAKASLQQGASRKEMFAWFGSLAEDIERVSRRVDGEVAARQEVTTAVNVILDVLIGAPPVLDMTYDQHDRPTTLRAALAQLT